MIRFYTPNQLTLFIKGVIRITQWVNFKNETLSFNLTMRKKNNFLNMTIRGKME